MTTSTRRRAATTPTVGVVRVATLTRISTDETNQPYSLDAQATALEAFVASQPGQRITHRFSDQASGATLARPGLQRALDAARAGQFDVLLVYRIDRLSRSIVGLMSVVEELDAAGVGLKSATEPIDTSGPVGRMLLQLLGIFAEFERSLLIDRISAGFGRKAARGEWLSGRPPFGYDLDKPTKTLIPNADAALVPVIFGKYLAEQVGAKALALWLNETGRRTATGKLWSAQQVLRLLRNPVYVGMIRHDGHDHPGKHPPLIDPDTYQRTQTLLDARADAIDHAPASDYLLSGLTRCTTCGGAFIGANAHGRSRRYRYYVCRARKIRGDQACTAQPVPADKLEQGVIDSLLETYDDLDLFLDAARHAVDTENARQPDRTAELAALDQRIKDTEAAIDRYLHAFENGTMTPATCGPRLDALTRQRDELTGHRTALAEQLATTTTELPSRKQLAAYAAQIREDLTGGTTATRKHALAALVNRVEIHPAREATPWFNVPTQTPRPKTGAQAVRMRSQIVELRGIEPLTSSMPWKRSTN